MKHTKNLLIIGALVAVAAVAVGCGQGGQNADVSTKKRATTTTAAPTTTVPPTTTTTLSPKQTAAVAYFQIVAVENPVGEGIDSRYFPGGKKTISWSVVPAYCGELAAHEQTIIDKINAVTWPPEVQAQATDLIAKHAAVAGFEHSCAIAPGTYSAQSDLLQKISKAADETNAAASAFRAVLGLPVAR